MYLSEHFGRAFWIDDNSNDFTSCPLKLNNEPDFDYALNIKQNSTFTSTDGGSVFYTTEDVSDSAWTDDDAKVVFAMKKGLKLVITGESSRGTVINDTYTLKGFTSAINKLNKDC